MVGHALDQLQLQRVVQQLADDVQHVVDVFAGRLPLQEPGLQLLDVLGVDGVQLQRTEGGAQVVVEDGPLGLDLAGLVVRLRVGRHERGGELVEGRHLLRDWRRLLERFVDFFRSIASAAAFVLTGGVPDRLMTRLSILSCFRNRHRLVLSL